MGPCFGTGSEPGHRDADKRRRPRLKNAARDAGKPAS
jgi:hypothetical protein